MNNEGQADKPGVRVLGITGGIASGKSSVAQAFAQLGAAVLSADELARAVVQPGSAVLLRLRERFGVRILDADGCLDRAALATVVFNDPQSRQALNALIHPAIAELAQERLENLRRSEAPLVVYEAPLLFEAGAEQRVDAVLVIKVAPRVQLQRLMARDGLDEAAARLRVDAQMPQEEKVGRADYVIDNSGSFAETLEQVQALFKKLARGGGGAQRRESSPSG
ncbi:dephospho-CoA kinase [Geoalkalibacter halelectricus]|uniref:dephospho-CoA kinase n=1 Tax=Geoalkalibacter halelectricus TaxID=2847045 RepID=UPI003D245CDE